MSYPKLKVIKEKTGGFRFVSEDTNDVQIATEEFANRLADCWNACTHMTKPELYISNQKMLHDQALSEISRLTLELTELKTK